eukprot:Sdes_comp10094_c0_seq1m1696
MNFVLRTPPVRFFRLPSGDCFKTMVAHTSAVSCLQFDSVKLVTGSWDTLVKIWDLSSKICKKILRGHKSKVCSVRFSGKKLVSGDAEGKVKVWDILAGSAIHNLDLHEGEVRSIFFQGTKLVSGGSDASVKCVDIHSGSVVATIGTEKAVHTLDFDEVFVYVGSANRVKVFRLDSGVCSATFPEKESPSRHFGRVNSVCANKTFRKLIFTAAADRTVKIWNLVSGKCLRTLEGHTAG